MKFKIRCSAISQIMAGSIGLTDNQKVTLADYESREKGSHPKGLKLTDKMNEDLVLLRHKRDNPELPQGAKTFCKSWLKQMTWKRFPQIKSRYIDKGNITEESGFTMICVQLGLGMIYKNQERKYNDWATGECDIYLKEESMTYDNKSSWDLSTFPMYDTENPKPEYEYQGQGYMWLWSCKKHAVVYTLIDCPEEILIRQFPYNGTPNERQEIAINLIYTQKYWDEMKDKYFAEADDIEFVEIPEENRVKPFYFERDEKFINDLKVRVEMCQKYIDSLTK